jgi:hypothetical protein
VVDRLFVNEISYHFGVLLSLLLHPPRCVRSCDRLTEVIQPAPVNGFDSWRRVSQRGSQDLSFAFAPFFLVLLCPVLLGSLVLGCRAEDSLAPANALEVH